MRELSEAAIRGSFLNASKRERIALAMPDLAEVRWDQIDYLGWRDQRQPLVGAVVAELDGEPVGVLLRQAERTPRSRAQCSWCEDVQLPNDVVFFSARRSGDAGRRGDSVGVLICAHFECSVNVRRRAPMAYIGFDVEEARRRRIEALREHVDGFLRAVRDGD